jgi:hypothetical protein
MKSKNSLEYEKEKGGEKKTERMETFHADAKSQKFYFWLGKDGERKGEDE